MAVNGMPIGIQKDGSLNTTDDDYCIAFTNGMQWDQPVRQTSPFMNVEDFKDTYAQKYLNYHFEEDYIDDTHPLKTGENIIGLRSKENRPAFKQRKNPEGDFSQLHEGIREVGNEDQTAEENEEEEEFIDEYGNVIDKDDAEALAAAKKKLKKNGAKESPVKKPPAAGGSTKSPMAPMGRLRLDVWKDYDNPSAISGPPAAVVGSDEIPQFKIPSIFKSLNYVEPRNSDLTAREQMTYIRLMQRFENRSGNEPMTDKDHVDFATYASFRDIVRKEQGDYEKFAREMLSQRKDEGPEILTSEARRYAEAKFSAQLERVRQSLPRMYYPAFQKDESMLRMLPVVNEQQTQLPEYEMRYENVLLELGQISKAIIPTWNRILNTGLKIDDSYERINARYPAVNENLIEPSQDSNVAKLAKAYEPDIVVSVETLQEIFASQLHQSMAASSGSDDWILPMKATKFGAKLTFVIDDPLPKCGAKSKLEKSQMFAESATKALLLKAWNYNPPKVVRSSSADDDLQNLPSSPKKSHPQQVSRGPQMHFAKNEFLCDEDEAIDLSSLETFGEGARVDGGNDSESEDEEKLMIETEESQSEDEEHPIPKRRRTRSQAKQESTVQLSVKETTSKPQPLKKRILTSASSDTESHGLLDDIIASQTSIMTKNTAKPVEQAIKNKYQGEKVYVSSIGDAKTDFDQPEEYQNVKFTQWFLRPKGKSQNVIKLIVKGNTDGLKETGDNLEVFTVSTKLETQLPFGLEKCTAKELAHEWMATLLRPSSKLARVRIYAKTQEIMNVDIKTLKDLTNDGYECGFNPALALGNLYNLFNGLCANVKEEGQYLIKRDAKNGAFATLLKHQVQGGQKPFDLHAAYSTVRADLDLKCRPQFRPLDMKTLTPFHCKQGRVPGLFQALNKEEEMQLKSELAAGKRGRGGRGRGRGGRGRGRGRGKKK